MSSRPSSGDARPPEHHERDHPAPTDQRTRPLATPGGSARHDEPTQPLPLTTEHLADGRYELGDTLGSGGMGIVRRARDHRLGRAVAIKLLADNLAADPVARERFLREARAAAAITDPCVVAVYDVGDEAGRPYLVMELVDGPSLSEVLRTEGPLPVSTVVDAATDALSGLAATHAAGIVHRDIKPSNLLRSPSGRVKLTDLGVAEAADAPGLTRTGLVVGTRSYLAPERRAGGSATERTDLYALGVTFVELLFGATSEDPRVRVEEARWLPAGLRTLLLQLLAGDPAHRPTSAAAARSLLEAGTGSAATTRPLATTPGPADVAPADDAYPSWASDDATTLASPGAEEPATSPSRTGGSPSRWRPVALGVALAAVVAVAAFGGEPAGDAGGTDAPAEQPPAETTDDGAPSVPRDDDPATTARNLAEWLRQR